jgi:hypothetical protein
MDTLAGKVLQVLPARIRCFLTSVQINNAMLTALQDSPLQIMMRTATDHATFGMGPSLAPFALIITTQRRGLTQLSMFVWPPFLQLQVWHPLIHSLVARCTIPSITKPVVMGIKRHLEILQFVYLTLLQ